MPSFLLYAIPIAGTIAATWGVIIFFSRRTANAKPMKNGVMGTAEVISVSMPYTSSALMTNCSMDLVISGPGIQATAVKFSSIVNTRDRPSPGQKLPVSVNPADPRKYVILWGQLPDKKKLARDYAEKRASDLRDHEGKQLGRGWVLEFRVRGDATAEQVECDIGMQVFVDGTSPIQARGRRSVPQAALPKLTAGQCMVAVWIDPSSPGDFVVDVAAPPPTIHLGRSTGPGSRDWLLSNGQPTTVTILGTAKVIGVKNYADDDCFMVNMSVGSDSPPVTVQNLQPIAAANLPLVKAGSTVPARVGSMREQIVLDLP
ncbi:hypothetical protein [Subtercola endophyticus]|uniref:hypothetical protein n=1 Tax=Subtercola endophyticus TaxID=2895559 RepID=UPI001E6126DE|nr:hypothetical protein [Subtercola endophyticus]UFS58950.1 hypothetical protein LQ955_18465 [Subtercola endophyticus]